MVIGFHADTWSNIAFCNKNPASAGFLHIMYIAFVKSLDIVIVIF